MAYTKKVAPKKSKKAVKKVTAKKPSLKQRAEKLSKSIRKSLSKPLLTPISPKKSKGIKLPPLSEKEKSFLGLPDTKHDVISSGTTSWQQDDSCLFVSDFIKSREQGQIENKTGQAVKLPVTGVFKITVRNVTEHTLKRVRLFDNDFMNQQDVHYSTAYSMSFKDFMRRKNAMTNKDAKKIMQIHIASNNTRQPFSVLFLCNEDITGIKTEMPFFPLLDPNQVQSGVVNVNRPFFFDNSLDIFIDFLDPDTRVTYTFTMIESE